MKLNNKKFLYSFFIIIIFTISILFIFKDSYAKVSTISSNQNEIEKQRKAIIESANAYYRKGIKIQYDTNRKLYDITPEQATEDNTVYAVCSTFVESVYYDTLGIVVPNATSFYHDYAKENRDSEFVIKYYTAKEFDTLRTNDKEAFIRSLISIFEPGDILTIEGHTMIIDSVTSETAYVIESWGNNGNKVANSGIEEYETAGSIQKRNINRVIEKTPVGELTILRPTVNGKYFIEKSGKTVHYSLTPTAKTRLNYPGIDIEKVSSMHNNSYVNFDDEIEYKIIITNNSNSKYQNIFVKENISDLVEIVDKGNGTYSNNILTWNNISIDPGSKVTIKYKVKVRNNPLNYGKKIESTGNVSNIKTATVVNKIGLTLTNNEKQQILSAVNKLKKTSSKKGLAFVNEVYKEALNIDLGINNLKITDVITNKEIGTLNPSIKTMILNDLYNTYENAYWFRFGQYNRDGSKKEQFFSLNINYWNTNYNKYVKNVMKNSLKVGDVVLISHANKEILYFCIGENYFLEVTDSSINTITNETEIIKLFSSFFYKEYLVSLSPALAMQNTLASIKINNNNLDEFSSYKDEYALSVDYNTSSIKIEATPTYTNTKVIEGVGTKNLTVGLNKIVIKTKNDIGLTKEYKINVTRQKKGEKSHINTLKNLNISDANINFDPNTIIYNISVDSNVEKITITSELTDKKSKYIEGYGNREVTLEYGLNQILIKVQSESGNFKIYTLNVTRNSTSIESISNTNIKDLIIKDYEIDFSSNKYEYNVEIEEDKNKLDIEVILENPNATYKILNNENLENGSVITIEVIHEEEKNIQEYKINIIKNKKNDEKNQVSNEVENDQKKELTTKKTSNKHIIYIFVVAASSLLITFISWKIIKNKVR